jgi:hypothetical protein
MIQSKKREITFFYFVEYLEHTVISTIMKKIQFRLVSRKARQPFWKRTTLPFAAMQLKTSSRFKSFK